MDKLYMDIDTGKDADDALALDRERNYTQLACAVEQPAFRNWVKKD